MPKQPPLSRDKRADSALSNEYTVDELAHVAGTTVRNVRAYQDKGLLAPPVKRGRIVVYDDTHLARLKLVHHLLARGYTLSNIQDLIQAVEEGHDLRSILGLETAIGSRWSHERPQSYSLTELWKMFGGPSPKRVQQALELGFIERDGLKFVATSPASLKAGAALVKEGIPVDDLLEGVRILRPHFDAVAKALVDLVVRRLDRYEADALPPPADVPALVDAIWRLRPLAMVLVESEMNRALEEASGDYLVNRVASILESRIGEALDTETDTDTAVDRPVKRKAPPKDAAPRVRAVAGAGTRRTRTR
ncbi:MerR family transcriptional regulator [Trinickia caryophylli]|uniref:Transcriptional regulator, MerR family n=1 Tax=Trinickia caryophylli TaxID=28094 RepID=A0A1X7CVG7_TRICW|nr:MerR family transcriptional regulator [Trinickia caryophylli]PMS13393.1 MerR family transcriptional regulator [Trinickia caryophylli]TRX13746.1 MerR family transcriptional regulator [Trinickia caryophylli]WQE15339.1 MerR family transcriptional regulator [Trinickia caryophylli]SMF03402.1 transcriptional regulator, MerR family [Trinickia caryophylli]GLU30902.1 MerR family transcriptional regulator [Trinickia caryophylli]